MSLLLADAGTPAPTFNLNVVRLGKNRAKQQERRRGSIQFVSGLGPAPRGKSPQIASNRARRAFQNRAAGVFRTIAPAPVAPSRLVLPVNPPRSRGNERNRARRTEPVTVLAPAPPAPVGRTDEFQRMGIRRLGFGM